MHLVTLLLIAASFSLIEANSIRVNNTGTENLVFILQALGHPPSNGTLIEAGNYTEFLVLNEWEGSFYTYPEECLDHPCDYPVTKISVAFEKYMFGGFYDFLIVDLNKGFNVPASIRSVSRPDCDVISCDANLLEICSEQDQVVDEAGEVVACQTSVLNYQDFKERCPNARVDGGDVDLGVCASMDYELTFG
ncbi:hypothetical protein Zmor_002563 [Zophobas morio]|uniref:Uncharacterized protein n=2 Tax=Zophobas morio TaxID=2755281 RepID=A0AA38MTR1_9CUCU|nr:hypothetical protein Zmor_002563 [Zophobas morio]